MTVRITWFRAVATLAALALTGFLIAWSGIIGVAASSGHWRITEVVLHWSMENSVRTHAAFTAPEPASAEGGLVSAAGHFAQSCAACHGAPGVLPLPVMHAAAPHAPDLQKHAGDWSDAQLFWILERGVKFSGMPFWAARDRPDEIKRMVAFVRALPGMSPDRYRALTQGADRSVAGLTPGAVAKCTGCHGADGRGRGQPDVPVLAGQKPGHLAAALRAFQRNERSSAVMRQAAAQLRPAEIDALARHFAAMPGGLGATATARADADVRAHRIATRGLAEWELPACLSCHDPRRPTAAPILHGQRATYLAGRLQRWRGDENEVDARKPRAVMPVISRRIPKEMIDPLARYFERAPAPGAPRAGPGRAGRADAAGG